MTPTDPNVTITQTVDDQASPILRTLAVASQLANIAPDADLRIETRAAAVRVHVVGGSSSETAEAAALALVDAYGLCPTNVGVEQEYAHIRYTGASYGIAIDLVYLIHTTEWLHRTVDDFAQLPEQGPDRKFTRLPLAGRAMTAHEGQLDALLLEAAEAEDVRPRDEELITAKYAAARRYAHAAGLAYGGCLCGRDAGHAPTTACVWKLRATEAPAVPFAVGDRILYFPGGRSNSTVTPPFVGQLGCLEQIYGESSASIRLDGEDFYRTVGIFELAELVYGSPEHDAAITAGEVARRAASDPLPGC